MKKVVLGLFIATSFLAAGTIEYGKNITKKLDRDFVKYYIKSTGTFANINGKVMQVATKKECILANNFVYYDGFDKKTKTTNLNDELFNKPNNHTIVYGYNDTIKSFDIMILIDREYFKSVETMLFNNKYDCIKVTGEELNYTEEELRIEISTMPNDTLKVKTTFELGKRYKMSNGEVTGIIIKATEWNDFEAVRELDYTDGEYRWDYEGKNPISDYDLVEVVK